MIIIAELIDVFKEYRNGNKEIFDTLYRDEIEYTYANKQDDDTEFEEDEDDNDDGRKYKRSHFKLTDVNLERIIINRYSEFTEFGIDTEHNKYSDSIYCGTIEDLKKTAIAILHQMFKDQSFNPHTSSEIYQTLTYKLKLFLGKSIGMSVHYNSDIFVNSDDEEYSYYSLIKNPCQSGFIDEEDVKSDYIGGFRELINILKTYDVSELCSPNATTQRNVIELLQRYHNYKYYPNKDEIRLPKDFEMISMYQLKYNEELSQQRYSAVLDEIFNLLSNCVIELKGASLTRNQYRNQTQRGDINNVFIRQTTYKTNRLIVMANKLIDYVPETVQDDTYYKWISDDDIVEICSNNKSLIANIKDKQNLTLDNYADTLNAIGYMLLDYCKQKVTYFYDRFMQRYKDYEFDTDNVFNVVMGGKANLKFDLWNIKSKSDGYSLLGFKTKNGNVVAFNGASGNVRIERVYCVQIGNAIFFVSDNDKRIYCRSADKELFFIKEIKHKYKTFSKRVA